MSFEETVDGIRRHFSRLTAPAEPYQPTGPRWQAWGPYGILGWRHLLTPLVSPIIAKIGHQRDTVNYRADPIQFFRELSNPKFRLLGRILYPFDKEQV
jgi:hypothetical protein